MSTNTRARQIEDSIIERLPAPKTPAQITALFGFACIKRHNKGCFPIPIEKNPILNILKTGVYPDDAAIKKMLPRPFKRFVQRYGEDYTFKDVLFDWCYEHQKELDTPTTIVEVHKLNPRNIRGICFGRPIFTPPGTNISKVLFNHLGHKVELGRKYYVHNFEIILPVRVY